MPVLTLYFQLGIDQTQTRLQRSAKSKSISAAERIPPPRDVKLGLDPNTVITTKLPVTSDENQL